MSVSLGVARGKISIDTSDVSKARVNVERESKGINAALKKAGDGADFDSWYNSTSAALKKTGTEAQKTGAVVKKSFDDSSKSADNFAKSLNEVGRGFAPISIGAGLIAAAGVKAGTSIEQVNSKFKALAGNETRAEALMKKIADRAKELKLPVQATQAAFAGLVPFIGQSQEAINKYVGLSARLTSLNPALGLNDAIFSLREAISSGGTDLISLAERFNLPKRRLRELVEQTGDFGKALDIVLTEMGATEASAKEIGGKFGGTFTRLLDAFNRMLAAGFKPLLEAVTPLLEQAADAVEKLAEQNPGILQVAAGFTVILGAVTPVLLAVGSLVSLFNTLSKIQLAANIGKGLGALGTGVAAIGAGTALGVGIVKAGNVGGINDRAASQGTSVENVLIDDFKKVIVVFVDATINAASIILKAGAFIDEGFQNIGRVLDIAQSYLDEGFGGIVKAIGGVIVGLSNVLRDAGLEDQSIQLFAAGTEASINGEKIQIAARDKRAQKEEELKPENIGARLATMMEQIDSSVGPFRESVLKSLTTALFPPQAEKVVDDATKQFQENSAAVGKTFGTWISDIIDQAKEKTAALLDKGIKAVSFNDDQIQAFESFQEDQAAIQQKGQDEREEENRDHQERMKKIDEDADRAIESIHDRAKKQAAADEQELIDKRLEVAASAKEHVAEEEASYQDTKQKIISDAYATDLKLTEQHQKDIEKLEREHRLALLEAASNLDARAVARENDSFGNKKGELDTKLTDDRAANAQQALERLAEEKKQHEARLVEIKAAGDKEIQQLIATQTKRAQLQATEDAAEIVRLNNERTQQKNAEDAAHGVKLSQIVAQTNRELQLREQAFIKQFNQLAGAENAKLTIAGQGQAAMEAQLRAWYNRQVAILSGITPRARQDDVPGSQPPGRGFATGTSLIEHDMAANVHRGEGVISAPVNAMIRSMMGGNYSQPQLAAAFAGGQQRATSLTWSGDLVLGDIGNHRLEDVSLIAENAVARGFDKLLAKIKGEGS